MALAAELLQHQGQEGRVGVAAPVSAPAAQESGAEQTAELPARAGGGMGARHALGREVGVSYAGGEVCVGELGEMGEETALHSLCATLQLDLLKLTFDPIL